LKSLHFEPTSSPFRAPVSSASAISASIWLLSFVVMLHDAPKRPPRQAQPGEFLFEFQRQRDGAPIRCELRNHGEYGWEAQFLERDGELFYAHGKFVSRAHAMRWAEAERAVIETGVD